MMISKFKHLFQLLVLYLLLLIPGIFLAEHSILSFSAGTYATLLTAMTLITMGAYLLVAIGKKRDQKEQGIFLIAAIGGKFLAYLILILIFLAAGKNFSKDFIIAFFVLYLLLTFFLVGILYKTLKSN